MREGKCAGFGCESGLGGKIAALLFERKIRSPPWTILRWESEQGSKQRVVDSSPETERERDDSMYDSSAGELNKRTRHNKSNQMLSTKFAKKARRGQWGEVGFAE